MKQLHDGSRAVVLFNRVATDAEIPVKWEALGYPAKLLAAVRDLWRKKDVVNFTEQFSAKVGSHDVVMVRVTL